MASQKQTTSRYERSIVFVQKRLRSAPRRHRFAAISKLKQNARLPIARIFLEAMELEQPNDTLSLLLSYSDFVPTKIKVLHKINYTFYFLFERVFSIT